MLAERVLTAEGERRPALEYAFRLVLARKPKAEELEILRGGAQSACAGSMLPMLPQPRNCWRSVNRSGMRSWT